jgi:hypothetical protein
LDDASLARNEYKYFNFFPGICINFYLLIMKKDIKIMVT